ncbi:MAG: hypothetical protein FJ405_04775 [Verrucomicrobia bacterium]|nr:hypothetical protein [Verrucomicrobiota bacterium]
MGLDIHGLKLLLLARRRGVRLGRVLTFGRIELALSPDRAAQMMRAEGIDLAHIQPLLTDPGPVWFAEPVFKSLGAAEVISLDASGYQNASVVHDMNQPIGPGMREQFDTVFDGGSIEHVFNFPVAIRNCMEFLKEGGSLFIHTAANNCMGHGFYQFSPELFYRVFSDANGFEVQRLILHGSGPYGSWYDVADPAKIRSRVELISFMPTQMLLHATRRRTVQIFSQTPQQSDYVEEWSKTGQPPSRAPLPAGDASPGFLRRNFPRVAGALQALRTAWRFYTTQSLLNRRFFTRSRD